MSANLIIRPFSILLFFGMAMNFCYKPEDYPDEPKLEFKSFEKAEDGDRGFLTVSFTDGDGNVGLEEDDTTGKFSPDSRYHNNLFLEYYEKQEGTWTHRELEPPFHYRIPPLEPEGASKALEGDIEVELEPTYYDPNSSYDTIKYKVILADRDLNESNEVETDPIITP